MGIKAIVFDIGGVLDKETDMTNHYFPVCKKLGIDYEKFMSIRNQKAHLVKIGKMTTLALMRYICKKMGLKYPELKKYWIKYKKQSLIKDRAVESTIKKLKKNGYLLGTLTDVLDLHQKLRIEKNFYEHFNFNIVSCEVGLAKPDPKIYKLLLKKIKLSPKEIVFIDDYQSCLDGAKKLGINTILFKNNRQLIKDLKKFGVKI